jgi:hypothetical protein
MQNRGRSVLAVYAEITITYGRGVAPANAGVRSYARRIAFPWIRAFAEMTEWCNSVKECVTIFRT